MLMMTNIKVSPFFNSEKEALAWFDKVFDGLEEDK